MNIDWSTLDLKQSMAALEMLLETDSAEYSCEEFDLGVNALLSHALVCLDETLHRECALLLRDSAVYFPNVTSILLNQLQHLVYPLPYLNMLPLLLSNATETLLRDAVRHLQTMLQQNSDVLLPVIGVLCELPATADMTNTVQILIDAISFTHDQQLPDLLRLFAKASHKTNINAAMLKFRRTIQEFQCHELYEIAQVAAEILPSACRAADAILTQLVDELDLHALPALSDSLFTMLMLTTNSGSTKQAITVSRIYSYWLSVGVFPFNHLREVTAIMASDGRWRLLSGHLWSACVWVIHEMAHCSFTSHALQVFSRQELVATVGALFQQDMASRERIYNFLVARVFEADKRHRSGAIIQGDTKGTDTTRLPALGEASITLIARLERKLVVEGTKFVVAELCAAALCAVNSIGDSAVIGTALFAAFTNRLVPDHDHCVELVPQPILETIFRIVVEATADAPELENSLLIMVQKLLGSMSSSVESPFGAILKGVPCLASQAEAQGNSRPKFPVHTIGILLARTLLAHGPRITLCDKRALASWIVQCLEGSIDADAIDALDALWNILEQRSLPAEDCKQIFACMRQLLRRPLFATAAEAADKETVPLHEGSVSSLRPAVDAPYVSGRVVDLLLATGLRANCGVETLQRICDYFRHLSSICSHPMAPADLLVDVTVSKAIFNCQDKQLRELISWQLAARPSADVQTEFTLCIESMLLLAVLMGRLHTVTYGDESVVLTCFALNLRVHCIHRIAAIEQACVKCSKSVKGHSSLEGIYVMETLEKCCAAILSILSLPSFTIPQLLLTAALDLHLSNNALLTTSGFVLYSSTASASLSAAIEGEAPAALVQAIASSAVSCKKAEELRQRPRIGSQTYVALSTGSSLDAGTELSYEECALFSIASLHLIYERIQLMHSCASGDINFAAACRTDPWLSSLVVHAGVDEDDPVHALFLFVETQVKETQDFAVACGGMNVLLELSWRSAVFPRCSSLMFLLSSLIFTRHTAIKNCDGSFHAPQFLQALEASGSLSHFASNLLLKVAMNASADAPSKLMASTLKLLSSIPPSEEVRAFTVFWLSWWVLEEPGHRLAGISLVLSDALGLFCDEITSSRSRSKADGDRVDALSNLPVPDALTSVRIPVEAEEDPSNFDPLPLVQTMSSSRRKLKRIVVNDDEEEWDRRRKRSTAPSEATCRLHGRRIGSVFTVPTKSFASLTSNSAYWYFELSFSLLPFTLMTASPCHQVTAKSGLRLATEGPYAAFIRGFIISIHSIQQLMGILKNEEYLKFLISILPTAVKSCNALMEALYSALLNCVQWRNDQTLEWDVVSEDVGDTGSLLYLSVLFAWAMEALDCIFQFITRFKQYFLDEGSFVLPKSLKKVMPTVLSKCEKHVKLVEALVDGHSLSLDEAQADVRTFLVSHALVDAYIRSCNSCFKTQKLHQSEAPLPKDWDYHFAGDDKATVDIGDDYDAEEKESDIEFVALGPQLQSSSTAARGWGLYGGA